MLIPLLESEIKVIREANDDADASALAAGKALPKTKDVATKVRELEEAQRTEIALYRVTNDLYHAAEAVALANAESLAKVRARRAVEAMSRAEEAVSSAMQALASYEEERRLTAAVVGAAELPQRHRGDWDVTRPSGSDESTFKGLLTALGESSHWLRWEERNAGGYRAGSGLPYEWRALAGLDQS
ncbi:hypothetical protein [Streptomyces avidinii]